MKLLLPVREGEQVQLPASGQRLVARRGEGTILVVEDELRLRELLVQMLKGMGFEVVTADDGRAAVALYAERHKETAVVLMDLNMPHMDGVQAFNALREVKSGVRVLLMSGYNQQESVARFAGKGLAGFLNKPFTFDQLAERLHAVLAL